MFYFDEVETREREFHSWFVYIISAQPLNQIYKTLFRTLISCQFINNQEWNWSFNCQANNLGSSESCHQPSQHCHYLTTGTRKRLKGNRRFLYLKSIIYLIKTCFLLSVCITFNTFGINILYLCSFLYIMPNLIFNM